MLTLGEGAQGKEKGQEIPKRSGRGMLGERGRDMKSLKAGEGDAVGASLGFVGREMEDKSLAPTARGAPGVGWHNCWAGGRSPPGDRDKGRVGGLRFRSVSRTSYQGRNSASITMH